MRSKLRTALARVFSGSGKDVNTGLERINARLGLRNDAPSNSENKITHACSVADAADCARSIVYAPDMDGQVDPGEVVWFWAPCDDPNKEFEERSLVVVGRQIDEVLGLLTSPNPDHADEENWLDIGSGPWDEYGRQSWVRLDRVVKVPEYGIRREGAVLPKHRFDRIANRLRNEYGWD